MAKGKKTGGRKAGVPNKRNAEVRAAGDKAIAQLREPFLGDGYALLALVYKDQNQPLSARMSAALMAMPYERPRLSQVAMTTRSLDSMSDEDFFKAWDALQVFLKQDRSNLIEHEPEQSDQPTPANKRGAELLEPEA